MRKYRAFTLVELLVVIGIIAVLLAIVVPTLSRARDAANGTKCLANLRQLSTAFSAYLNDNDGHYPSSAPATRAQQPQDWLYWRAANANIFNNSRIAKYTGAQDDTLRALLRCPADDAASRMATGYGYSYVMNSLFDGDAIDPAIGTPLTLLRVHSPGTKVFLADESELTINDGNWVAGKLMGATWIPGGDWLSIRHDGKHLTPDTVGAAGSPIPNPGHRGNVAFCDGHAEFVTRSFAHAREHADPAYAP